MIAWLKKQFREACRYRQVAQELNYTGALEALARKKYQEEVDQVEAVQYYARLVREWRDRNG